MRRVDIATAVGVTAVWGVAFVGIKKVLEAGPPLTMAGVRFVLAGALLVPLVVRRPAGAGRRPAWREVVVVGALQTTGLYGFGFLGIQHTTAGAAALLLNTNPVMVALLAVPLLGDRLTTRAALGAGVGLAGVAVVSVRSGLGSPWGITLLLLGALCWAAASVVIKRLGPVDLLRLSCGQMLVGGLPLLAAGLAAEGGGVHFDAGALAWFAFLVVPATAVNFAVWFRLLERYSAGAMTSWLFLIPVFGVASAAWLLDEPLGWRLLVGGVLVVAGVLLAQEQAAGEEVVIGT